MVKSDLPLSCVLRLWETISTSCFIQSLVARGQSRREQQWILKRTVNISFSVRLSIWSCNILLLTGVLPDRKRGRQNLEMNR